MASEPKEDRPAAKPSGSPDNASSRGDIGPPSWVGLVGIGFEFLATVGVVGAIGWYADRHWNTFPWLTIAGGAVGFAAGLVMMVRAAKSAFKD